MGWLWLAVLAGAAGVLLWRLGVSRVIAWFAAAALMLGATGYALQGSAGLPGKPVVAGSETIDIDPGMVAFREAIMPGAPGDHLILASADNRLRSGDTEAAANGLLQAIARNPGDAALWAGLGGALAAHDAGQMSPAARFAFARALRLAPGEPGPPFFLGLAYVQAGDLAAAKTAWLRALALTPRDAPYRVDIAERLVLIDQFQAMNAGASGR